MRGYRNPLGALQASRPDPEAIKRAGWQGERILVVALDDERLDGFQREFVKQIGESLYGNAADSTSGNRTDPRPSHRTSLRTPDGRAQSAASAKSRPHTTTPRPQGGRRHA